MREGGQRATIHRPWQPASSLDVKLPASNLNMTPNEANCHTFAAQFEPALKPVPTQRINGVAYKDAWTCSFWSAEKNMGVTCVTYEGQIHAYLEATGRTEHALQIGRAMAAAMGRAADGNG